LQIENLDHLGLIAAIIDELGLVELGDRELGTHSLQHVSPGQVLKAMILNGLGFVSAPLYLFSEFFQGKPVEHLLGPGIRAEHLNDDRLGRVLDGLFSYGTTLFFLKAAMLAVERFEVKTCQVHLDSTSFALEGEYESSSVAQETPGAEEPQAIEIRRGYSRDHRPELKQFLVNLICTQDGGVPMWFKVGNGNDTDSQQFAKLLNAFAGQWDLEALMVVDAAFYSESNLNQVGHLKWLTRVPQTLSATQALIEADTTHLAEQSCELDGYRLWEQRQSYGGIEQRWILVESQQRRQNDEGWNVRVEKQEKALQRQLKELCRQIFACKPEALEALLRFQDTLETHTLTQVSLVPITAKRAPGRPKKRGASTDGPVQGYQLQATLERQPEFEETHRQRHSRFILATNVLDTEAYPAQRLLQEYKQQQQVERGFRFLKDPLFFTSSVFVKKPQRVEALALVMALTLLVYTLGQRKLRQQLTLTHQTILDQKQKPTDNPTLRWVLQKFQAIHLVTLNDTQQVSNLTDERNTIVRLFGLPCCRYYLLN
jgi:transposase